MLVLVLLGDVALDGSQVVIQRPGQTVCLVSPSSARCAADGSGGCPTLDGKTASRILKVAAWGLVVSNVRFVNGRATEAGEGGGCLTTANSSTTATVLTNTAWNGCSNVGPQGGSGAFYIQGPTVIQGMSIANTFAQTTNGAPIDVNPV